MFQEENEFWKRVVYKSESLVKLNEFMQFINFNSEKFREITEKNVS